MLLAIFIVPLVYFINAFMIGRFIKRVKISANPFLCTIIGFFSLFTIFYIFDIFLYVGHANMWAYLVFYSVIQAILFISYVLNWKRIFITFSFNWKKVVTFIATAGLTVLISWLCLRNINSEFGLSWVKTINDLPQPDLKNIIYFGQSENDMISNFSSFNIFNIFWINSFKISGFENCLKFCQWSWIICGALIFGCIATWLFKENSHPARLIISPIICLSYLVVITAFIESFAVVDMWIMVLVFVYVLVLAKRERKSSLKLFNLTILLLSFLAINCTSYYVVISLWLFSVYWAIRNKENSLNYLVCLSWPLILVIFSFISIAKYWMFALGNAICLLLALIVAINFVRRGSPVWSIKFARSIAKNSGKVVYTFIFLILAVILVANFFIFHEIYHWQASNIDYKNFLTFTYKYIWSFELKSDWQIAIINAILYAFFAALIITFLIARSVKKSKIYAIAKKDSAIKLAVAAALLFINPLVIHVLKISTSTFKVSLPINTLALNVLFVAPLFIALLRLNFNLKDRPVNKWAYDWF